MDEPTSGLDATAALQVCRLLKRLAEGGLTVVAVLHQPRAEIWEAVDRVVRRASSLFLPYTCCCARSGAVGLMQCVVLTNDVMVVKVLLHHGMLVFAGERAKATTISKAFATAATGDGSGNDSAAAAASGGVGDVDSALIKNPADVVIDLVAAGKFADAAAVSATSGSSNGSSGVRSGALPLAATHTYEDEDENDYDQLDADMKRGGQHDAAAGNLLAPRGR